MSKEKELARKLGQAYQVLGVLLLGYDHEGITDKEAKRALDYFSDGRFDDNFLSWPREEKI